MSVASSISAAMDADASKKERHKAFQELQFHSSALVNFTVQLKQLEDHFNELEKLMQKRFEELGRKGTENEKEKKSAAEKSTVNSNIEKEKKIAAEKSTGIPNKTSEEKSAAEKSTVNSNIEKDKKFAAEKSTGMPNKTSEEKSAAEKSTVNSNIEKEKKFAAEKSTGMPNKTSEENSAAEKSTGNPNKTSEKKSASEKSTENPNKTSEKKSAAEKNTGNPNKTSPALKDDVKPRPQLKSLCEKMDGEGLMKFLVDTRSDSTAIRNEAPAALRCAADPAMLVLQTLEGFYPVGNGSILSKASKAHLGAQRYACELLLESLPFVLSPDEVSSEAKKDAQKVAAAWKSKLDVAAESSTKNFEAQTFLRLLASYGISKEFKDDDICELVLRVAYRQKIAELCLMLQISHRIPDVVEKLSSSQKYFAAVQFVYAFGLVEKFPPIPLLKAYLEDKKKESKELVQKRRGFYAKNAETSREIASLNTVVKFIEVHKLESQMSIKDIQDRVGQLQRAKYQRKRHAKAMKSDKTGSSL